MRLKVEMDNPNDIQELQEYLYERNPDLISEEVYDIQPGFHKEPVTVAIIIALGGPAVMKTVQILIQEFFKWKRERTKAETEREQSGQKHQEEIAKLSLQKDKNWEMVQKDDFIKMEYKKKK